MSATLPKPSRFNVRVYGILIEDGQLLVNEEVIQGKKVIKFPGGGVELGEGLAEALQREWNEELGLELTGLEHFYTTDFFQPSAFDDSQVISVYYRVHVAPPVNLQNSEANERSYWMPLKDVIADTFSLPIDRVIGGMLAGLDG